MAARRIRAAIRDLEGLGGSPWAGRPRDSLSTRAPDSKPGLKFN